jgi:muconolactone D-isomerase
MQFLVKIAVELPERLRDPGSHEREDLLARELERGLELRRAGTIERIWRIPGGLRNVGIWHAADASELHAAITSLPFAPWMHVEVTPLADHPVEHQ